MVQSLTDAKQFKTATSGFATERELVDYLELNIDLFCSDVLREEYESHIREWQLRKVLKFGTNRPSIDLMLRTQSGRRVGIECKRPRAGNFSDISRTVSQVLSYDVIARDNGVPFDQLIVVITQYDDIMDRVISA